MMVAVSQEVQRAHRPPNGHVTASEVFLKFRVRFPLHQCFRIILNFYELTVFQVMPNVWAHTIGFFVHFAEQKMDPPSLEEFSWFYTLKSSKGNLGFYYFAKRATKDVQAVTKIKESLVIGRMLTSLRLRPTSKVTSVNQVSFSEPSL